LPLTRVSGEAEALRVANDTQYGLSSCVFTREKERGVRFALGVEAGMTHVNNHSVDDTATGPFGGEKNSGIGRFEADWDHRSACTSSNSFLNQTQARRSG
jgi:aldehyde dehydrogenase (NAD+)